MVSVKLSLIPNFAIWDLPHDYPPTLSIPTVDKSSIFSRAPFSIPENLFFRSLDYKWPLLLASSYVLTVKTWNYVNRQRGGKPWAISKTSGFFWFMVAHNVFLAVYSAWTFVGIVGAARRSFENPFTSPNGFRGTMDSLCRMQGTSGLGNAAIYNSSPSSQSWFKSHPLTAGTTQTAVNAYLPKPDQLGRLWNEGLAFYGWWFYISKFYEFIDTAIILLKGKQSSTLQTYHHMGACGCLFVGIKYMSPPIWIFLFFNSFIHSLMYTYYTVTSFNIRVPKAIKRSLTTAQITQFIVGGGSALLHLFVYYKFPTSTSAIKSAIGLKEGDEPWVPCLDTSAQAFAVWFNVIYLTPLTYLFARFFVRSYLRSSSTTAGAGQGKKKDVRSTLQAAERAGKDAVEEFGRAEVLENTSAGRSTASAVGVNGNGNGNGAASRKGWERTNKVVD